jgi:FkbM family methyltransferase
MFGRNKWVPQRTDPGTAGVDASVAPADPRPKRQTKSTAAYLRHLADTIPLEFDNVIDVGVNVGTPELYNAFSDRTLVLIEPSIVRQAQIEEIVARRDATWIQKGAGSQSATMTLIEDLENPAVSSFSEKTKHAGSSGVTREREVEVDTLDHMLVDVEGRHFLKIDTEGHEFEVLKGATETLHRSAAVMMEISITERYVDGYVFSEVITLMRDRGFEIYDILFVAPEIRTNNRTKFVDALFIPVTH